MLLIAMASGVAAYLIYHRDEKDDAGYFLKVSKKCITRRKGGTCHCVGTGQLVSLEQISMCPLLKCHQVPRK